jgi:hypothetical protein
MTVRQQARLVRLPDGRRLAFASNGPAGVPCIVLGMPAPSSRPPGPAAAVIPAMASVVPGRQG